MIHEIVHKYYRGKTPFSYANSHTVSFAMDKKL